MQLYLNTLISYLYVAVSNILAAVTKYITLKKISNFNSPTLRKKVFWVVINSSNRSDGILVRKCWGKPIQV